MTITVSHRGIIYEVTGKLNMGCEESVRNPCEPPYIDNPAIMLNGVDVYDLLSDSDVKHILHVALNMALKP